MEIKFQHSSLHHWKDKFRRHIEKPSPAGVQYKLQTPAAAAAEPPSPPLPLQNSNQAPEKNDMQFHQQHLTNFKVPKFLQKQQHHQHTKVYTNKQKKKFVKIVSNQPNHSFKIFSPKLICTSLQLQILAFAPT